MPEHAGLYHGYRFPREVIAHAVRLYLRFALSFRDVEELLAERGVQVSYETVRRWVAKFGTYTADELRRREVRAGRTWHLDEMATRVGGGVHWLRRAVDEYGQTLDVFLRAHRDTAAAERFFPACSLRLTASRPPGSRPTSWGAPRHRRAVARTRGCRAPARSRGAAVRQPHEAGAPTRPRPRTRAAPRRVRSSLGMASAAYANSAAPASIQRRRASSRLSGPDTKSLK